MLLVIDYLFTATLASNTTFCNCIYNCIRFIHKKLHLRQLAEV